MSELTKLGETMTDIMARLGITPRPVADHTEYVNATREAVWHRACQLGNCRYATDNVKDENPPAVNSLENCGGYHGARHMEEDPMNPGKMTAVWRWRPCVRHRRWAARRHEYENGVRQRARALATAKSPRKTLTDQRDDDGD